MTTPNYHGWTESNEAIDARRIRREINYAAYCVQTEADTDRVREIVIDADAYAEREIMLEEIKRDAEWLGTHVTVSGGEVEELGPQSGGEMIF